MALPDSAKTIIGTILVVADTTDHGPAAANNLGTRTDQIDCTDLAGGAARQSDKLDFTANMDEEYVLAAAIEMEATPAPASGEVVDFYMAWSNNTTAGTANPGGIGGADAAYTGTGGDSLDDSVKQLDFLGSMVLTADVTGTVQIDMAISTFKPRARWGTLVVYNRAASAAFHSDMDETSFLITPLVNQVQD